MRTKVTQVTQQIRWIKLRAPIVTDDATVLGVTTRNFANKDIGEATAVKESESFNAVVITFMGKPADQTAAFAWRLYGSRAENGPSELLAYGTGNIGDTAVTVHSITGVADTTIFYADFLTITAQYHIKTIGVVDIGASSGEIAKITFDLAGLEFLRLELTDCNAGTANETDQLESIFTGF